MITWPSGMIKPISRYGLASLEIRCRSVGSSRTSTMKVSLNFGLSSLNGISIPKSKIPRSLSLRPKVPNESSLCRKHLFTRREWKPPLRRTSNEDGFAVIRFDCTVQRFAPFCVFYFGHGGTTRRGWKKNFPKWSRKQWFF